MTLPELEQIIEFTFEYGNATATTLALLLSSGSLIIQWRRAQRQIGELEIISIDDTIYRPGRGDIIDVYDKKQTEPTRFKFEANMRNIADGTLYIYDVFLSLEDIEEDIEMSKPLTGKKPAVAELSARQPIMENFSGELDHRISFEGSVEGKLKFNTSNGTVTKNVVFEEEQVEH